MPDENPRVWKLVRDGRTVAEITVAELDMPWTSGIVNRLPGFEDLEQYFADDLVFLNNEDKSQEDIDRWEAASDEFDAQTDLVDPSGRVMAEFLMHVDGDEAWWRWELEPFD